MKKKLIITISAIALACIACGSVALWKDYKTKRNLQDLVAYNDSIRTANSNLVEYIEFREDSIDTENRSRLGVSFFIKDEMRIDRYFEGDFRQVYVRHELRDALIDSLKKINFVAEDTVLIMSDCNEYDDELWDEYGVKFNRELYGRKISVSFGYKCWKRTQNGDVIPEQQRKYVFNDSFTITFSSGEDYEYFLQTLRKHDYIKTISESCHWSNGDPVYEYQSHYETTDSTVYIRHCDDPIFSISDNLSINVNLRACNG